MATATAVVVTALLAVATATAVVVIALLVGGVLDGRPLEAYRLGYQDALGANPLADLPERDWAEVIDRSVAECADSWESDADPGGPDWEQYCAGQYAGWADKLRGTYRPVQASWHGYDAD